MERGGRGTTRCEANSRACLPVRDRLPTTVRKVGKISDSRLPVGERTWRMMTRMDPCMLLSRLLVGLAILAMAPAASAEVAFDWVTVGDPGNACDTQPQGCIGSVGETYRIAKFEVTNSQYAEFLNAVAATDTHGLYITTMGDPISPGFGGITRSGSSGSFSYSTISGRENMPVNLVTFWDAARFANWLHNGQPTGAQDDTTTEDGAYTLTPTGIANNTVARNAGAAIFLPSDDEWYKAAYYDPGVPTYYDYPAGTDSPTPCALPGPTANTAN